MSDMLRITGLSSGMDTDTTVKKLIQMDQIKIDRAEQEKTYLEWQKEDYRDIANTLRGFQDEYFDLLTPETNLRSTNTYNLLSATAKSGGASSEAVSIITGSLTQKGSFNIDSISQLATADKYVSGNVVNDITTGSITDMTLINSKLATNSKMSFTLDGVSKTIELSSAGYADIDAYASALSTELQSAFTNVDITANVSGTEIAFNIYSNGTTTAEDGHKLAIGTVNPNLVSSMGLASGDTNILSTSESLATAFGTSTDQSIKINGKTLTFTSDQTIDSVMEQINKSGANVVISFNALSDSFTLESTVVGNQGIIELEDTSGLLSTFKLQGGDETHTDANSASFVVDGVVTTRDTNEFEFNGMSIKLNETSATAININVESDTSDAKDMIVKFVESYNEVIAKLNEKTSERKNYDYDPLTDAQKTDMNDDDIEAWNTQARKGTLSNNNTIEKITRELRTSLYEAVEGLDITLADIGIQTSANYKDAGKLVIDENKLDIALKERPNEVIELFTKQSDTTYRESSERSIRKSENGIAYRIYDILQDSVRITRDDNGNKGSLIEKAGNETGVDITSDMAKKLLAMDDKIDRLLDLLASQEEKYYSQFAAMESAMSSLNSQGEWLASQFS